MSMVHNHRLAAGPSKTAHEERGVASRIRQPVWVAGGLAVALVLAWPTPARAEIVSVEIHTCDEDMGTFQGRPYLEITATMKGTAELPGNEPGFPTGEYSVPITIAVPKEASDFNGLGFVDIPNTVPYYTDVCTASDRSRGAGRAFIGDEYLFGSGFFYIEPMWDAGTYFWWSPGVDIPNVEMTDIDTGEKDSRIGYTVLSDASELMRHPDLYLPPESARPDDDCPAIIGSPVDDTIGFGFSQTAALLQGSLRSGTDLGLTGAIYLGSAGRWTTLAKTGTDPTGRDGLGDPYTPSAGAPESNVKAISVNSETEVDWRSNVGQRAADLDHPTYRFYEVAGTSHIPGDFFDMTSCYPDQIPVSLGPVLRKNLDDMVEWVVNGTPPPSSVHIETVDIPPDDDDPDAKQLVEIVRDEHGNAVGGLRLPHLFAPVGTYVGLGEGGKSLGDSSAFFLKSAGTFYPFDDDQLRELYPTHGAYVSRVAHGADYAFDSGWILSADQDAYIQSAAQSDYGK